MKKALKKTLSVMLAAVLASSCVTLTPAFAAGGVSPDDAAKVVGIEIPDEIVFAEGATQGAMAVDVTIHMITSAELDSGIDFIKCELDGADKEVFSFYQKSPLVGRGPGIITPVGYWYDDNEDGTLTYTITVSVGIATHNFTWDDEHGHYYIAGDEDARDDIPLAASIAAGLTVSVNSDASSVSAYKAITIASASDPLTELSLKSSAFGDPGDPHYQSSGPQFFHGQTSASLAAPGDYFRQRLQAVKTPYYSAEQVIWAIEGTSDDPAVAAEAAAKYELYDARTGGNIVPWDTATDVTDVYIGIVDGKTINARNNADEVEITVISAVNSGLSDSCVVEVSSPDLRTINGTFKVYNGADLTRNLTADETVYLYVVDSAEKAEPQYREIKPQEYGGEAMYELNLKNSLTEHIIQANIDNMLLLNTTEDAILEGNTWIGVPYDEMRDEGDMDTFEADGGRAGDFKFVELPKITGTVVDGEDNPVEDVVVFGPSTATTGADGKFEMYIPLETFTYERNDMQLGVWKDDYYLDYSVPSNAAYKIPALLDDPDLINKLKAGTADINVGDIKLAQEMLMDLPLLPDPPPTARNPFENYDKNTLRLYPGELSSGQYATAMAYIHNSGATLTGFDMMIAPMWADLQIKMPADGLYLYELPSYTMTKVSFTTESAYFDDEIHFTIPEFKADTQYMFSFGVSAPAREDGNLRIGEIGSIWIVEDGGYGYGSSDTMLTITDLTVDCPPEVKKGEPFMVSGRAMATAGTRLELKVIDMFKMREVSNPNEAVVTAGSLTLAEGQSTYKFTVPAWEGMDAGVYEIEVSAWNGNHCIGGYRGFVRVAPDPVVITSAEYYDNVVRMTSIPSPSPDFVFPLHVWMLDEYKLDSTRNPYHLEVGLQSVIKPLPDDPDENGGEITGVTIGIQTRFGEFTYEAEVDEQSRLRSGDEETTTWKAELNELAGVGVSGVYAYVAQKSYTEIGESFVNKIKVMNLSQIVDPSGYVYDSTTNAKIKDATATLYYRVGESWEIWPAENYQQTNPQKTDIDGKYGWMVPEGDYEVRVTKSGYTDYTTLSDAKYGVITVLPARTDINIGLSPTKTDSSSGGGGGSSAPSTVVTVPVEINGTIVSATVGSDGTLTLAYTPEDIVRHKDDSGNLEIAVPEQEKIVLSFPVESVGADSLTIVTDFGTIAISNETLSELRKLFGDTLRLSIIKGSFKVALLDENGKEIPYSDPKNPFTITLPYALQSGQNPGAVVATKKGKVMPYAVYENGSASFEITETGLYDLIYNEKGFRDIAGHWANDNITFLAAREVVSGIGDGAFSPDTSMTRAMFAQVLASLDGADLSGYNTSRFSDVPIGRWYSAAVEWAADMGFVNGVGDGKFDPNANVTREQMAVMMVQYMRYRGYALPPKTSAAFAAEEKISQWAVDAVKAIQAAGIVGGKPGNLFDPRGTATRAEVATIFARFIGLAADGNNPEA